MPLSREQALQVLEAADLVCPVAAVSEALSRMAREISSELAAAFPLVLCVMRGGVVFAGQLLPLLRFPLEFDYIDVTRYGDATRGGDMVWNVVPAPAVAGRVVLVLEDILDEGSTLAAILERLIASGASRVFSAVFADKDTGRPKALKPDFTGVRLPNRYVFGFGMDVGGVWRNLPEIYALNEGGKE